MRKTHDRVQSRAGGSPRSGSPRPARPPSLIDGFESPGARALRLTGPQTTAVLRMATRLAAEIARQGRRTGGPIAPPATLRQVAFFAAVNSLRAFDPARGVSYRTWARSHAAAAVHSYLRDQRIVASQLKFGGAAGNGTKSEDLISWLATPPGVAKDSGLPITLVRDLLEANPKGFVLFFPGRNQAADRGPIGWSRSRRDR